LRPYLIVIDETERKGKNKESWQKLGKALVKSRRKKAAEEQLKESHYRDIEKENMRKEDKQQQQLNLVPLGEQQVQIRGKVSKPTAQFEGDEFIPKGTPSELLDKYINSVYK
jgi:hypothetical protein